MYKYLPLFHLLRGGISKNPNVCLYHKLNLLSKLNGLSFSSCDNEYENKRLYTIPPYI